MAQSIEAAAYPAPLRMDLSLQRRATGAFPRHRIYYKRIVVADAGGAVAWGEIVKRLGLGIDVGGTFTDIVVYDTASGRQASHKELTTHDDPSRGVIAGIDRLLAESAIAAADIGRVVHATTLFTNALIERKGAPTGLITTRGFRDTLEIGRERKYELYDIKIVKPAPLVPRRWRLEVPERMAVDGSVRMPLDEGALLEAAAQLAAEGVTSVAIVFLHSYANPRHERRAVELIARALPQPHAVGLDRRGARDPRVRARLDDRHQRLHQAAGRALPRLAGRADRGARHRGAAAAHAVERRPHQHRGGQAHARAAAGIGPGRGRAGRRAPRRRATAARMCWPSTWAAPPPSSASSTTASRTVAYSFEAARERPLHRGQRPAGAHLDPGADRDRRRRRLHRPSRRHRPAEGRPRSAPAPSPAPPPMAAVAREPTVTDADLVLGYLNPAYFVGGTMAHRHRRRRGGHAAAGRARRPQRRRGLAWGIHDLVNENMASAARVHIAEHGKDPRRYALLPPAAPARCTPTTSPRSWACTG